MMLEAQRRGYEIHYMEMNDLHLDQGVAIADTKNRHTERRSKTVGTSSNLSKLLSYLS